MCLVGTNVMNHPELLEDWPVDDDLVVPVEALSDNLKDGMGSQWRLKRKHRGYCDTFFI